MTAQVFTATVRPASGWSLDRKSGGSAAVVGADFSACTTVNEALAVCATAWKTEHTVDDNQIGKATSVLN